MERRLAKDKISYKSSERIKIFNISILSTSYQDFRHSKGKKRVRLRLTTLNSCCLITELVLWLNSVRERECSTIPILKTKWFCVYTSTIVNNGYVKQNRKIFDLENVYLEWKNEPKSLNYLRR